jgi:hypothetical protein
MKKKNNLQKQKIVGGGVMTGWVAIMGITMLLSTVSSAITDILSATNSNGVNNASGDSYSASSKKQTYMRLSPFPARSVIGM